MEPKIANLFYAPVFVPMIDARGPVRIAGTFGHFVGAWGVPLGPSAFHVGTIMTFDGYRTAVIRNDQLKIPGSTIGWWN